MLRSEANCSPHKPSSQPSALMSDDLHSTSTCATPLPLPPLMSHVPIAEHAVWAMPRSPAARPLSSYPTRDMRTRGCEPHFPKCSAPSFTLRR